MIDLKFLYVTTSNHTLLLKLFFYQDIGRCKITGCRDGHKDF